MPWYNIPTPGDSIRLRLLIMNKPLTFTNEEGVCLIDRQVIHLLTECDDHHTFDCAQIPGVASPIGPFSGSNSKHGNVPDAGTH